MSGMLMLGRVQSLAKSKIGRYWIEEGIRLVGVIQNATTERHYQFSSTDFLQSPPRRAVVAASVYAATSKLKRKHGDAVTFR